MSSVVELVRSWHLPRAFALAAMAAGAAACSSESTRFNSSPYASQQEATGSIQQQRAPHGSVQTSSLPPPSGSQPATMPASGVSGGGRGMASYHPGQSPEPITTGSVQAAAASAVAAQPAAAGSPVQGAGIQDRAHATDRACRRARRDADPHRAQVQHAAARARAAQQHPAAHQGEYRRPHHHSGEPRGPRDAGRNAEGRRAAEGAQRACERQDRNESGGASEGATQVGPGSRQRSAGRQTVAVAAPAEPPPTTNSVRAGNGSLSFRWPAKGRIIAGFGPKTNGQTNDGINIALPEGTPIKAAEDGVVAYAGNELKGYGNLVLVRHADGFVTAYAHAKELLVKRGDPIKRGQTIARSGQTGNVDAPQLHFEIRKGPAPIDPMPHLSGG